MTYIELQDENGKYRIEIENPDGCDINWVADSLIIPVLRAAGYAEQSINELFAE